MTRKRKTTFKHPLIPGFWYIMINFPLVFLIKVGETSINVKGRAKEVDRKAPGIPIPIFFVWCPFNREMEHLSHALLRPIRVDYYKGDGHREWFLLPGALIVIPMMCAVWAAEIWLLCFVGALIISRNESAAFQASTFVCKESFEYILSTIKHIYHAISKH